jgi:hypothetical protein
VVGLCDADGEHAAPIPGEPRQHSRALRLVQRLLHDLGDLERLGEDHRHPEVAPAQLLDDHGRGERIGAEAAVFPAKRHGADADVVRLLDDLPGETLRGVLPGIQFRRPRRHLLLRETAHGLEDPPLLLGVNEYPLHQRPPPAFTSIDPASPQMTRVRLRSASRSPS